MNELTSKSNSLVDRILRGVDAISIGATYLAAVCLVALTILMSAQIVVSTISKIVPGVRGDIPFVWEYAAYLMGTTFVLGSGMTLRAGRHIRLTILSDNGAPWFKLLLEVFAAVVALALMLYLTFSLGRASLQAMITGTTSIASKTPLWIPFSAFTVGSAILALQLAARLLAIAARKPVEDMSLQAAPEELG